MRYAPPQVGSPALIPDKSPAAQITPSFTGSHSGCVGRDSRSLTTHVRQAHFTVAGSRRQKQRPCSAPPAWPSAASCAFLHGEALQRSRNPHSIFLRAAESRRGRHSVDDTVALAARAVGLARHLGRLARLLRPKGDAQREGAIDAAARGCGWRCGCACPAGLCATARGVASPPLLLVATIVLFRVQGCEEGSKSAVAGFRHAESVLPPRY